MNKRTYVDANRRIILGEADRGLFYFFNSNDMHKTSTLITVYRLWPSLYLQSPSRLALNHLLHFPLTLYLE
jgi:hypothetical protein